MVMGPGETISTTIHTTVRALRWLCLPLLFLMGAHAHAQDDPPPEASSHLSVELMQFGCDVWGGDGEGLPAIWEVLVAVRVRNHGEEPARVEGMSWTLHLGEQRVEGEYKGEPIEVPAGAWVNLDTARYITLEQLDRIREGVRSAADRTPRQLAGQVDFSVHGAARFTPFTVVGTWRGCGEPDPESPRPVGG